MALLMIRKASSLTNVVNVKKTQFVSCLRFSTVNLARFLESVPASDNSWPAEDYMCKTTLRSDGFLGLPFELKDGGPDEGYLNLVRNCGDEIIEVKVRPYYGSDGRISWRHESFAAARERVLKFFRVYEKAEDRGSAYDNEVGEEIKSDEKDIEYLYMMVKIYYGDGYKKLQKMFVLARHDEFKFPSISVRVEGDHKHLEEFEGFLKQRGIEPNTINIMFDDLVKQIKELTPSGTSLNNNNNNKTN